MSLFHESAKKTFNLINIVENVVEIFHVYTFQTLSGRLSSFYIVIIIVFIYLKLLQRHAA